MRYADDFVIGIEGSFQFANLIFREVNDFVEKELGLRLNPDKTGIVKFTEKSFKFLGYSFMAPGLKGIQKAIENITTENGIISRRKKVRVRVFSDYLKVISRLEVKGFIRKRVNHSDHKSLIYRGTFKGNLINLDHADIIRYYNSVIRGI